MTSRYPANSAGGVERVVASLAKSMPENGSWAVKCVHAFEHRGGIASVPLIGDLIASVVLAVRTIRSGTDVILVHCAEYAWASLILGRWARKPVIVVWHGLRGAEVEVLKPTYRGVLRPAVAVFGVLSDLLQKQALKARATIVVGQNVADDIRERFGFEGHITVIPNGTDKVKNSTSGRSVVAKHEIAHEPRVLRAIWIGTTAYKKGLDIALDTCASARVEGLEIVLTVVGLSKEEIAGAGLEVPEWVNYAGKLTPPDVDALWDQHDVLLFPTRYEACSMTVLEAMSAGVPVIGSAVIAWQVGEGGRTVLDWAVGSYVDALLELTDEGNRSLMSATALSRAEQFSWERAADSYLATLDGVLKSGNP